MTTSDRLLSKQEQQMICRLADPDRAPPDVGELTNSDADMLFEAARDHNVEPVLVRKLSKLELSEAFTTHLAKSTKDRMFMTAIGLALDDNSANIHRAMESDKIPNAVVKGAAFARDLYPFASDRPYSDIDILVPKSSLQPAMKIMSSLGYTQHKREHFDKSAANEEQKWGRNDNPLLLIELHTNLVHVPSLRNRISLGYDDYAIAGADGAHPLAGHFVVAVMHAAAGHKFHQLKLLVDVLQAARALSADDIGHIAGALPQLKIHPEISMCLALLDELFFDARDNACTDAIRSGLDLPFCWKPVDAHAVMNAPKTQFWRSKIRRHAFRYYQMTFASRSGN